MTPDTQEKKTFVNKILLLPALILVILLIMLGVQSYQKTQKANAYFDEGMALIENKSYEDAARKFSDAIRVKPEFAEAYYQRGLVYIAVNEDDLAMQDFEQAIELEPKLLERLSEEYAKLNYTFFLRETFMGYENHQNGLKYLDRVVQLNPEYEHIYIIRGDSYFEAGLYEEAVGDFTIVLEEEIEELTEYMTYYVYIRRAYSYYYLDDLEKALEDSDKLVELNMSSHEVYKLRGYVFADLGDYEEALLSLNKAIELFDDEASPYFARAKTYLGLGEKEKAEADLKQALSLCKSDEFCSRIELALEELSEN